jgi:hypothetical protein
MIELTLCPTAINGNRYKDDFIVIWKSVPLQSSGVI